MDKQKAKIISLQIIMVLIGCVLIGNVNVAFGVLLFLWADNLNNARKPKGDVNTGEEK